MIFFTRLKIKKKKNSIRIFSTLYYMYITGRVNCLESIEDTEELLCWLPALFEGEWIITREDKKKCGLPTHLHYHFIYIPIEYSDKIRPKIRKLLTDCGWIKHHSSVKVTEDKEKAIYYVLKQQDVYLSTVEDNQLQEYLQASMNYNSGLQINSWNEHLDHVIEKYLLENKDPEFDKLPVMVHDRDTGYSRKGFIRYLHNYVVEWNKEALKEHKISFINFHPSKIYTLYHYAESKLLDNESSASLVIQDCLSSTLF